MSREEILCSFKSTVLRKKDKLSTERGSETVYYNVCKPDI